VSDSQPNIWQLQARSDISGLEKALLHSDANIRKRAAAALRALDRPEAIPALQAALKKETDAEARMAMQLALDDLAQQPQRATEEEVAVKALVRELNDFRHDPEKLIDIMRELGNLGNKLAADSLVLLFNDQTMPTKVRLAAAETLIKLDSAPTVVTLLVALRHKQWRIRRNAAAVLGQLKAEWAAVPLSKALGDENEIVRRTAQAALINIGTPEAQMLLHMAAQGRLKTKPLTPKNADRLVDRVPTGDEDETPPASANASQQKKADDEKS